MVTGIEEHIVTYTFIGRIGVNTIVMYTDIKDI